MQDKSFWRRPEGVTGFLFLAAFVLGGGWLLFQLLPTLLVLAQNTLYLAGMLAALGAIVFVVLDPKARALVWYSYMAVMRWMTGLFVKIDPISILKSYIEDLENNLRNLSKQIGALRGQMRQLKGIMDTNRVEMEKNIAIAQQAQRKSDEKSLTIATRKAGRLQDANAKYDELYRKMEMLYRILTKMYENSEIVLEDTKDQVTIKEQEYEAIRTGHGAIRSAMSVISGDPDKRALFDRALETMTEEVSTRVGEMERFMDTSRNLMASIDLQNGVFEEDGLRLLEEMEKTSVLLAPPGAKKDDAAAEKPLDISTPPKEILRDDNDYHRLFE
jgi:predicted  nucleic acid-binding Zn-ribbon protein